MKNEDKVLHIMMGLPGSGKTTYIHYNKKEKDNVVNLDDPWISFTGDDIFKYAAKRASEYFIYYKTVWIDGLILTKSDVKNIIKNIDKKLLDDLTKRGFNLVVHIHQFELNRDACKNNDLKRTLEHTRRIKSGITIDNADYEILSIRDIGELEKSTSIKIEYEQLPVKKYGTYDLYFNQIFNDNPDVLISEEWSLGGTWGNYRGEHGSVEADDKPDFDKLDEILTTVCPSISFLQYKYIMKHFVNIVERSEGDYYGGYVDYAHYEANMKEIYDFLINNNLLKKDENGNTGN